MSGQHTVYPYVVSFRNQQRTHQHGSASKVSIFPGSKRYCSSCNISTLSFVLLHVHRPWASRRVRGLW